MCCRCGFVQRQYTSARHFLFSQVCKPWATTQHHPCPPFHLSCHVSRNIQCQPSLTALVAPLQQCWILKLSRWGRLVFVGCMLPPFLTQYSHRILVLV